MLLEGKFNLLAAGEPIGKKVSAERQCAWPWRSWSSLSACQPRWRRRRRTGRHRHVVSDQPGATH